MKGPAFAGQADIARTCRHFRRWPNRGMQRTLPSAVVHAVPECIMQCRLICINALSDLGNFTRWQPVLRIHLPGGNNEFQII